MSPQQPKRPNSQSAISLKDLGLLYLSKWYWFIISVFVCLLLAMCYLLRTPATYTRSASILIKEDAKGNSMSTDIASTFSDMGMLKTNTKIENEIVNFKSPDLMYEVVRRLHLDVNYTTDGHFHRNVLYGDQLPLQVTFCDLQNQDNVSLTIQFADDQSLRLTDFVLNGEKIKEAPVEAHLGDSIQTPVGSMVLGQPQYEQQTPFTGRLYVTRTSLYSTTNAYQQRLLVALEDKNTTVIRLSIDDQNIQRAEEVLNTIINIYNENWIKDKNQITTSTNDFINERLKVIQQELGDVDAKITEYKSANMIPDLSTTAGIDIQQATEQNKEIIGLNNQMSIARSLRNYISGTKNQLLPANAGLQDQSIMQLINSYNETQLQRNRLVESSSEENVLVKDLDQQLESLRMTVLTTLENYMSGLSTQLSASQSAKAQATSRIASNPVQAGKLLSDERQQKVKESLFLFLLQKREENELSQAFTSYNTRVVSTPEHGSSMLPTAPVRKKILLMAFLLGLALPAFFFYLRETMSTTVRSRKDLNNLAAPFLGEIPQAYHKRQSLLSRWKKTPEQAKPTIVVKPRSRNIINEAFRVIRTNLEFMHAKSEGARIIMITSANPGSGKTFISANLSTAMAVKGKRTLAIDLDIRRRSLSEYFNQPKLGVADYLSGNQSDYKALILHHQQGDTTLDVLPVGTLAPNPAELLSEARLSQMLQELRTQYDYIFLDCPPVEVVTDADIISPLADSTLFIIRADLFERSMLPEIDKIYNNHKYANLCVLLNGTEAGGRYGYKYGYAKYGYGYTHED